MESVFQINGCAIENQVKKNNVSAYTERFQELTMICTNFVADETEKINKYVSELPDNIYGSMKASKRHFKRDCLKLKNKDREKGNAPGWVYAVRNAEKMGKSSRDPDSNVVTAYTERFQELTMICTNFVADETEKINKYVSELPDNIYGSMKASKRKTLDETIELDHDLMDQKLRT
nr:hypothetical protein [Tanacetum cinerariifolium]